MLIKRVSLTLGGSQLALHRGNVREIQLQIVGLHRVGFVPAPHPNGLPTRGFPEHDDREVIVDAEVHTHHVVLMAIVWCRLGE